MVKTGTRWTKNRYEVDKEGLMAAPWSLTGDQADAALAAKDPSKWEVEGDEVKVVVEGTEV